MRERPEQILKFVCWGLGALVFFQVVRTILHANPLAHVAVPALPLLAKQPSAGDHKTRTPVVPASADKSHRKMANEAKGNLIKPMTNAVATGTPSQKGTNSSPHPSPVHSETNALAAHHSTGTHHPRRVIPVRMAGGPRLTGRRGKLQLSPETQTCVDRITDSEILGPVIHPLPMALLGIAGDVIFLRAPNGRTSLVKEGDELGGIKLLGIGTNRVLIEQAGQKKELTIFGGVGGQSLLDKPSESSHETNTH